MVSKYYWISISWCCRISFSEYWWILFLDISVLQFLNNAKYLFLNNIWFQKFLNLNIAVFIVRCCSCCCLLLFYCFIVAFVCLFVASESLQPYLSCSGALHIWGVEVKADSVFFLQQKNFSILANFCFLILQDFYFWILANFISRYCRISISE